MLDINAVRAQFPALAREVGGRKAAFLDGPGGTQTPEAVLKAMRDYLVNCNANCGGDFVTSQESDLCIEQARQATADLLGAESRNIAFGANMTTLNYSLSRALARDLRRGDEIVITHLDHDANICPWRALEEQGIIVKMVPFTRPQCQLQLDVMESLITPRTRVVAFGMAANAVGTVNDAAKMIAMAKAVGAITVVDAVHYVPHFPVDVRLMGVDFLLCSAYKFFGPHVGILYGRDDAFSGLRAYRIRGQLNEPPHAIETGTLNHEGIAGVTAAVDFIASLGDGEGNRRERVIKGMKAIDRWERPLADRLMEGIASLAPVQLYGPPAEAPRCPTVSFTVAGKTPQEICARLGEKGFFLWSGNFAACNVIEQLGLEDQGGLIRAGFAPYNTTEEIDSLLHAISELV